MRKLAFVAAFMLCVCLIIGLCASQSPILGSAHMTPDITVRNLSVPSSINTNSPLIFTLGLGNEGSLAATNITLNIMASGPAIINRSYPILPLSPSQNESVTLYTNLTHMPAGLYNLEAYTSYLSNGTMVHSTYANGGFSVIPITPHQGSNRSIMLRADGIAMSYMPLYTSLFSGGATVSELGIKDTSDVHEIVNISVGSNYTDIAQLSTGSVYLQPNQTTYVQLVLRSASSQALVSTYIIPITLKISSANLSVVNLTQYISLRVSNRSDQVPRILNDVALNYTNSSMGTVEVQSGINSSISNATLAELLPESVANSASQITAYGLKSNVTNTGNWYMINWELPYLPKGQLVYAYYTITGIQNILALPRAQSMLFIPSSPKPSSVVSVVNLSLPTLYTNSTSRITVQALYTGTKPQSIYFYLTVQPGISVSNASQSATATPNLLMSKSFYVTTGGNTGTTILTLYINTQGANITYSLPLLVLQKTGTTTTATPTTSVPQAPGAPSKPLSLGPYAQYLETAAAAILIILIICGAIVLIRRPRYKKERANRLAGIKSQINGPGKGDAIG